MKCQNVLRVYLRLYYIYVFEHQNDSNLRRERERERKRERKREGSRSRRVIEGSLFEGAQTDVRGDTGGGNAVFDGP